MRREDAEQRALMEHRRDLAGLNRHEVAADSVDDGLEDDEAGELADGSLQHESAHSGEGEKIFGQKNARNAGR